MITKSEDPEEAAFLATYDVRVYPRPSVAVDVVLLTVGAGGLQTVLVRRTEKPQLGRWALPGGIVRIDESLEAAAHRVLATKVGLTDAFIEQLYTFGAPDRDPRTRVISVVYYALVDADRLDRITEKDQTDDLQVVSVDDASAVSLAFDHREILATAIERIRGKLDYAPIGFEFLPATFTLRDLRLIHEAILGRRINKDSFRRKILDRGLVVATGDRAEGLGHRPPELYRFVSSRDRGEHR